MMRVRMRYGVDNRNAGTRAASLRSLGAGEARTIGAARGGQLGGHSGGRCGRRGCRQARTGQLLRDRVGRDELVAIVGIAGVNVGATGRVVGCGRRILVLGKMVAQIGGHIVDVGGRRGSVQCARQEARLSQQVGVAAELAESRQELRGRQSSHRGLLVWVLVLMLLLAGRGSHGGRQLGRRCEAIVDLEVATSAT